MYLFFDTETTGLPKDWNAPADQFPRLVQLAWLTYTPNGHLLNSGDVIIKPEGFEIPEEASNIHGITNKMAINYGEDLKKLLHFFKTKLDDATHIIGHNLSYDRKIIRGELIRCGIEYDSSEKVKICTMHSATKYCKLEGKRGYKWPKLQELHTKLFGKEFEGAHDAMADIRATAKCFWELKRLGVIKL
ncbi:3'-5' exonuclease [bacterium]|nr:3'-5' exonuclease [bacterium]